MIVTKCVDWIKMCYYFLSVYLSLQIVLFLYWYLISDSFYTPPGTQMYYSCFANYYSYFVTHTCSVRIVIVVVTTAAYYKKQFYIAKLKIYHVILYNYYYDNEKKSNFKQQSLILKLSNSNPNYFTNARIIDERELNSNGKTVQKTLVCYAIWSLNFVLVLPNTSQLEN